MLRKILVATVLTSSAFGQINHGFSKEIRIERSFQGMPVPQWSNGYFFGFGLPQGKQIVYAYDGTGRKLFESPIQIDGVSEVSISAMTASRQGVFAVAGGARDADGRIASFIAYIDSGGILQRVLRPTDFTPTQLSFAGDGSLWVAGRHTLGPARKPEDVGDHDTLRKYDSGGVLQQTLLPRSSFSPGKLDPAQHGGVHLSAGGASIVFLSVGRKELVWISPEGVIEARHPYSLPGDERFLLITGFGTRENGELYLSCQWRPEGGDVKSQKVSFFRWNGLSRRWQETYARTSVEPGGYHAIVGSEDDQLIVSTRLPNFRWIKALD